MLIFVTKMLNKANNYVDFTFKIVGFYFIFEWISSLELSSCATFFGEASSGDRRL